MRDSTEKAAIYIVQIMLCPAHDHESVSVANEMKDAACYSTLILLQIIAMLSCPFLSRSLDRIH